MSHAFAMVAKHLMKIRTSFDNGIPYHFTEPSKVMEIKDLVSRCAERLDYSLPTSGTAHLRMNTIVKEFPNKESWQYGGGVLTSENIDAQIEEAKQRTLKANPGKVVRDVGLTCYILNEWERYSVVFELVITVGLP